MSIPVYIIAGFLGTGKTTLINHVVKTFSNSTNIFIRKSHESQRGGE